jgi:hypothetical protein
MGKQQNKIRDRILQLENISFFVFVPAAAIAIFSDNVFFETACLISGIVFAVTNYLERQL